VVDARGRWAFASLPSTARAPAIAVLRRDGARLRLAHVVALERGLQPRGLHLSRGRLLIAAGAAVVSADVGDVLRGGAVTVRRLATGAGFIGVVSTRDGRGVLATDESRGELVAVRGSRVSRLPLGQAPVGLALSEDERHVFVVSEFDADWRDIGLLSVVDVPLVLDGAGRRAVRASVAAGCHPVRVLHDPERGVVWVSARESDAVLAFDAERPDRPLATVPTGPAPIDLALVDGGRSLVVAASDRFSADARRGRLQAVDAAAALAGRAAFGTGVQVGRFPRALAVMPGGTTLLVANYASRTVELLPAS
jgi:DNA-binding beta-propeller fold protein YncE